MNSSGGFEPSHDQKMVRQAKTIGLIALVLLSYVFYATITPVNKLLDKAINPAVGGLTLAYSKISTALYGLSGVNLGLVTIAPDPEFLFSVQLATYINEKQATPLLRIASDIRLSREKRERALRAILKFESSSDWIQAFLNELPKGGLLGVYEEESPLLDELAKKIREDGGVKQELVQAYAEVVFGFMLQVPDAIVRRHALKWVTDVIPADAVHLIAARLAREDDPAVRESIEEALFNIKAVSDPKEAIAKLSPHYQKPQWPGARVAVAAVLSRLGHDSAVDYVNFALKNQAMTEERKVALRVASSMTGYPTELKANPKRQSEWARLDNVRESQRRQAWSKYQRSQRQLYAQAKEDAKAQRQSEPEEVREQPREQEPVLPAVESVPERESVEIDQTGEEPAIKEPEPVKVVREKPTVVASKPMPSKPEEPTKPTVVETVSVPEKKSPPKTFLSPALTKKDEEEPKVESRSAVEAKPAIQEEEPGETYASLPDALKIPDNYLPPVEEMARPPKSLMNFVDVVFEVIDDKAVVFEDPGSDNKTGVTLTKGSKGKAELEMLIGEDRWYQVKSKQGNGWVKGASLSVFNLSPAQAVPGEVKTSPAAKDAAAPLDGPRQEQTYFEAGGPDVPIFSKPGESSKKIGALSEEVAYLAEKSERKDGERWFLLKIRTGERAWVRGTDIRLANVQQPAELNIPTSDLSLRNQKSAFLAEWIVATVKGVGVYSRPSIAGAVIKQIDPPNVYKVLELSAGGGKEWYRIQLPGKKEGWVQSMDVNLTKPK